MRNRSTTQNAERHRLERAELLLIRIGQHIFREWRAKGRSDKDLEASFENIWALKREIRNAQEVLRVELLTTAKTRSPRAIRRRA